MLLKRNDGEVIIQYGVKGMKWGVSRGSSTSSSRGGKKKKISSKKSSKSKTKTSTSKTKSLKDMSDDDIKKALDRIDLEKRYIAATTPAKRSASQKIINNIMTRSAENIGTQVAAFVMGKMVNAALKKQFPDGIVDPKNIQKKK